MDCDNPGLDPKLTPQNCYISTAQPNTDTDADRYNTVATVVPRYGSGLYGRCAIKYNRIDLAELFRGMSPVKVQGHSANETYATRDELPAFIGETYGLPIRDGDVHASSSLQFFTKPTADFNPEPDQAVTLLNPPNANHVLVLKVSETMCSNLAGFLTFYY